MLAALALFLADAPGAQALNDARTIAESGTLATIGDFATKAETEEIIAAHPDWTADDISTFRGLASDIARAQRERAVDASARAYLDNLSPAELAAIAAFSRSEAPKAQRAAMPKIMADTVKGLSAGGPVDFKGDTMKAFCAKTGKLCEDK